MSKNNSKSFSEFISANRLSVILGIIIVVFFGLMFWLSNQNKIDLSKVDTQKVISASEQSGGIGDHIHEGTSSNSKVVLIQYGDFQCPACSTINPKIAALAKDYGKKITMIFRNYPISPQPQKQQVYKENIGKCTIFCTNIKTIGELLAQLSAPSFIKNMPKRWAYQISIS